MKSMKYGVVYTPDSLATFVAELLIDSIKSTNVNVENVLDPACGEGALLMAYKSITKGDSRFWGIDIDDDVIQKNITEFELCKSDAILPRTQKKTKEYWQKRIPKIQAIIANPPWSSEKIYDRGDLRKAGFKLVDGQYDSYVLFIELAYNLLQEGGFFAFIIPDSLFDAQNEELRKFLVYNTQIKVIARLGEKLFENINRAATVLVCQKKKPETNSKTTCFRLSTDNRKEYLAGKQTLRFFYDKEKHVVMQKRFKDNVSCNFDIDTREAEESLLEKIRKETVLWDDIFKFGRGVEISKTGEVTICTKCHCAQGYTKKQYETGKKKCTCCNKETVVNNETICQVVKEGYKKKYVKMIVGEDVHRYVCSTNHYIKKNVSGINYKEDSLYQSPKLLVRKTGLGIYAAIDYSYEKTSQTVYILKYLDETNNVPLEYYLAILNSRVVYYYYLKVFGENEWKSHPYLTKKIIFSLPIRPYVGDCLDEQIIEISTKLSRGYSYELDMKLENLIIQKYGLNEEDKGLVIREMNSLPNLSSVNNMKYEVGA